MSTNTPFIMVPVSVAFDNSLPDKARRLWEALEHFSGNNRTCWPGYATLAKKVGCSVRWIPELLRRLVKAGLLIIQYRQGTTNIYTLVGRVTRQKATQEVYSGPPRKPTSYNQKQPPKTNKKGGSTPLKEPTTEEKFKKTAAFLRGEKVDWSK